MKSLYSRPESTELDDITQALHNLYKDEGETGLRDVLGPTMTKHIRELITIDKVGPRRAIEVALKLYAFVQ